MPDRWGFNRPWTTEDGKVQNYDAVRIMDAKGFRITSLFGAHRQDYADMIVKSVNKANIKVSDAKHEDTNPEDDSKTDELAAGDTDPDEAESGDGAQESLDTEPEEESEDDEPSGESSSDDDDDDGDEDSGAPEKDENETAEKKENPLW